MLTVQCIRNVLIDLAGFVSKQNFTKHHKYYEPDQDFQDNLGLDSMQIMELAAYVNSMFHIFETDKIHYLLENSSVDHWVNKVLSARAEKNKQFTFRTSGTTGSPVVVTHTIEFLMREIAVLATFFKNAQQVVSYVPAYSIYGFLFTVLLPGYLNIPVVHASQVQWNQLSLHSILVATPFHWPLILPAISKHNQVKCYGVSATAALTATLSQMITEKGVNLLEVYGSTETSGIGYRKDTGAFQLFPYLSLADDDGKIAVRDNDTQLLLPLQDELFLEENNCFTIKKRKDNKVNIAGNLVDLSEVEDTILGIDNITRCSITAKSAAFDLRLSITIILKKDTEVLRAKAIASIKKLLPAHKTPGYFHFETNDLT